MNVPKDRELQQIACKHISDISYKKVLNFYKKCTAKPYYFLVIDITLALGNPLRFRNNLLERIYKLIMTFGYKIRDEKLEHDNDRDAGKISSLSSGKIDKHEHFIGGEEIYSF